MEPWYWTDTAQLSNASVIVANVVVGVQLMHLLFFHKRFSSFCIRFERVMPIEVEIFAME